MSAARVHLDHNAGSPIRPEVAAAMVEAFARPGNASSVHAEGRAARAAIDTARRAVAELVGASPKAVTFTSGATEANVTALVPEWRIAGAETRFDRLIVSAVEHPSVLAGGRFPRERVGELAVDADGLVRLDALDAALAAAARAGERALVALQLANNETGVVQPVAEAAAIAARHGAPLHVDAVQAPGRLPIDGRALGAATLALSAHKLGGPQGIGALVRFGDVEPRPLLVGGGQEGWRRAGTESVAGIVGFGVAARAAAEDLAHVTTVSRMRDWLEAELLSISPSARVIGRGRARLPNTTMLAVPGLSAETAVIAFDLEGIAVSSGSACSSGKVRASHVLAAMGLGDDLARAGVRLSLGWSSTVADVERAVEVWRRLSGRFRIAETGEAA